MSAENVKPVRIQRSRRKGAKLVSPNGLPIVCVTRGTKWGNPFKVASAADIQRAGYFGFILPRSKEQCVISYSSWLRHSDEGRRIATASRTELQGKNLACWCGASEICHADVLLELANA